MNEKKSIFKVDYADILAANENPDIRKITVQTRMNNLVRNFKKGMPEGEPCGIDILHTVFRWVPGFVYCFTGYPGSGKSEIIKYLSVLRVQKTGCKVMMYSPESDEDELIDDLARMYLGKNTNKQFPNQCSEKEYLQALEWVEEHFEFVDFENMPTVQTLLDYYSNAIVRGFTFFVTDPFNYVAEGSSDDGKGISRYLKTALSHMKTFAKRNKVINVIVEHPNQPTPGKDGEIPRVNQWRIYGGSMWNNKMGCIVGITRDWDEGSVLFETLKMKSQRYNGVPGIKKLRYEISTGRYYPYAEPTPAGFVPYKDSDNAPF